MVERVDRGRRAQPRSPQTLNTQAVISSIVRQGNPFTRSSNRGLKSLAILFGSGKP
jgi:hypothetical protein